MGGSLDLATSASYNENVDQNLKKIRIGSRLFFICKIAGSVCEILDGSGISHLSFYTIQDCLT